MEVWPSTFPAPDTDLNVETAANTVRTQMDSGLVRQRRRFSTEQSTVQVSWTVSDIQMGVFVSFHKSTINLGADWFEMPLSIGGDLQTHVVRFINGQYTQTYAEVGYWTITAELDIEERHTYSDAVLVFYVELGLTEAEVNSFLLTLGRFHNMVNVTSPINLN